jgi:hypothetical protein
LFRAFRPNHNNQTAPAAIANAVCDALAPFGVEVNATPIKPEQLVRARRAPA